MSDAMLTSTVAPAAAEVTSEVATAPLATEAVGNAPAEATVGKWVEQATPENRSYEFLKGKAKIDDLILYTKSREEELSKMSQELAKVPKKPGADAKPEEIAAWRKDSGLSVTPEDYKFAKPEGAPENKDIDNFYRGIFHEVDLPVDKAEALYAKFATKGQELVKAQVEAREKERTTAQAALQKSFGQDYDANMKTITEFGKANFGENTWKQIEASGLGNNMEFISSLLTMGKEFGTGKFIKGASSGQTEAPSTADILFPSMRKSS